MGFFFLRPLRYALVIAALAGWQGEALSASAGMQSSAASKAAAKKKQAAATTAGSKKKKSSGTSSTKSAAGKKSGGRASKASSSHGVKGKAGRATRRGRKFVSVPTVQSRKLVSAFTASAQLRPMAQQLSATRSAAAYAGVQQYAVAHPGEGASAAYLALGHAFQSDRRFGEAYDAYRRAAQQGKGLDDYADYLSAQAAMQAGRGADAIPLLDGFAGRYPESIFVPTAPVMLANVYLQQNNAQAALRVLAPLAGTAQASHADFRYTQARANQMAGNTQEAAAAFRKIYLQLPFSNEAGQSRTQLQEMGQGPAAADRKVHADLLFNAKRYGDAGEEYHALQQSDSSLSQADKDALQIYMAVCDLKLKRLSRKDAERLPATVDDTAALKMYILAEISRNENDVDGHRAILTQMMQRYPKSRWLEEALYSGGNMYLLKHDATQAIWHYSQLYQSFPNSTYAPSAHWRSAWMNYRVRNYPEAARLMEEQIQRYPTSIEAPTSLYWRARMYEEQEKNLGQAVNYYQTLSETYRNYYYALLARQRLVVLKGQPAVEPAAALSAVRAPEVPELIEELPENDVHLIKARLLANASLNEFIAPEIQASSTSAQWGALAQAEIYASYGENARALQSMKRSGLSFFALPIEEVPSAYWHLVFPRPYWNDIAVNAQKNGLDPYLVASLIRQESEFNPGAVSRANAYGLMQLLPPVGKALAKKQGMRGFSTATLLNPTSNIELGTANLKQVLDRFGGQVEYALAAYNAGDTPVRAWMATNDYKDIAEFVESIPYTETREYVQGILRNREMYRAVYK